MESHYRRAASKKKYLDSGLTIARLYGKYVEKCTEQLLVAESDIGKERFTAVKEHVYRGIFNHEFNLEFHKPKQDRCNTCELYKFNKDDEKNQRHASSKLATKLERDKDREREPKLLRLNCILPLMVWRLLLVLTLKMCYHVQGPMFQIYFIKENLQCII